MNTQPSAWCGVRMALAAAGILVASAPALAQETPQVTIQAERSTKIVGRTSSGTPIELITLTRRVSYADLDLKTSAGAMELEKRVSETATDACKELDRLYPLSKGDTSSCVKTATDNAMAQVRTVVAAAQKSAVNR